MAKIPCKQYHDEEFDAKELVEKHVSHPQVSTVEEHTGIPLTILHNIFCKGHVKAEKAVDISFGAPVYQLFSLSNKCKEIHVVQLNKSSMEQFTQWLENGDEAADWSYTVKRICHLEGNKQEWKEKENQTKKAIKRVYQWYDYKTSDIDPSMPEMDCVITMWLLNAICQSKEEFQIYLEKFTSRLKSEGHLLIFSPINMSYYGVGDHHFHMLPMTETEIQECIVKARFVIEKSWKWAPAEPSDVFDYSHLGANLARKE